MSIIKRKKQRRLASQNALANTSWPMIHCDPQGSKTSPYAGPTQEDTSVILAQLDSDVILMLSTPNAIYVQEAVNYVKAFHPETLELLATSPNLEAVFPFFAGGNLDEEGYLWFTANNRVARLSPDLSEVVWSELLEPSGQAYNTCCFLPDGNFLVTTSIAAHVLSSKLTDGTFKVISSLDLYSIMWNEEHVYPFSPIMPRPVSDEEGGLYFTSDGFMSKLFYDQETQTISPNVIWAVPHEERDASFNLSDAVVVSNRVYAAAIPQENNAMQVYSVDCTSGEVEGTCIPFPDAIGYISAHCVGAVPDKNMLIVICNTPDLTGGMAAVDATTMEVLWQALIAQIGASFCCSSVSNRGYLISTDPEDGMLKYWAINLDDGSQTVLHQYPSDVIPSASLASIGYDGRLYYPNPTPGLAMIQDTNNTNN